MNGPSSARKAHAQEMREKAGNISSNCEPTPVRGDIKIKLSTMGEWGSKTTPNFEVEPIRIL
jgi:hypothetical protein